MLINFQKITVSVNAKYVCSCGHKFSRKNSDWFTMSPFNHKTYDECYAGIKNKMENKKRICPKCKEECIPINKE